ncbi:MAG TPA: transketolase C-terminal domain-containing protein [Candidatus Saccharimonadales bacterium]|nr:transketolase C-terminal domain-containing protein [Candidatus Saccharimonadales bacterium]
MLNQNLKLNTKLFDEDAEVAPTRAGFGTGLLALGEINPNVVALSADLTESTQANKFAEKFPERFFQTGIGEQNMATIAAGLAASGKVAFISSYATFSPGKNWETLRTTAIYNEANVKIAGHHSGIMTGPDGATHQATEDIAITRCWPKMHVYVPCDAIEAKKATIASADISTPVYLRYTRDKTPLITTEATPFKIGKMQTFWVNENPKVTIFATGYMLYYALLAAKELEEEKIQVLVVNAAVVKPLDEEGIIEATRHSQAVVTVEDHQVEGGMGSAIAELLAKTTPLPIEFIGLQNTFAESGTPKELLAKYGMDIKDIKNAVKRVIRRKI